MRGTYHEKSCITFNFCWLNKLFKSSVSGKIFSHGSRVKTSC